MYRDLWKMTIQKQIKVGNRNLLVCSYCKHTWLSKICPKVCPKCHNNWRSESKDTFSKLCDEFNIKFIPNEIMKFKKRKTIHNTTQKGGNKNNGKKFIKE